MGHSQLWKYCTKEQLQDFILSLHLLPENEFLQKEGTETKQKQLACLYTLNRKKNQYYHSKTIPKKDGGERTLMVPDGLLKIVQKNILHHVLDSRTTTSYATAYQKDSSLLHNAAPHIGKKQILKLDIRHFFDSIIYPQILGAAFPEILFPPQAGALLTSLCSFQDRLPQGAPTSPAISNLVMQPFDRYMGKWCARRGISYTRYCDDMAFSGDFDAHAVYYKVKNFLGAMGFDLNEEKTKLLNVGERQIITGIVVNEKAQVPRNLRRRLRQEIHYCIKYGVMEHLKYQAGCEESLPSEVQYLYSMLGKIQFVLQINPLDEEFIQYRKQWIRLIEEMSIIS